MVPTTRYAKNGTIHIAYQVIGRGPLDRVLIPGFVSHVEYIWEKPRAARFLEALASYARLILFDKRGTGLSDQGVSVPTFEERMDDVRAAMDAEGVKRAALFGISEGATMALLFAVSYPERTPALVLCGGFARLVRDDDYPFGYSESEMEQFIDSMERHWGGPWGVQHWAPSLVGDIAFRRWWTAFLRMAASPDAAAATMRMAMEIDARQVLPAIRTPTLIVHAAHDRVVPAQHARYLAGHIDGARLVKVPGEDYLFFTAHAERIFSDVKVFLTGMRGSANPDRVLATVMFCDIAGSAERAAAISDRSWRDLLWQYYKLLRRQLNRYRGREIDTAGDGLLSTFDGPARAVQCASRCVEAVQALGINVRAGVHTGECERFGEKLSGIAVHIGARVASLASANAVLVTRTVRDLVAGSTIQFQDRGRHMLKGLQGTWRLYAVVSA